MKRNTMVQWMNLQEFYKLDAIIFVCVCDKSGIILGQQSDKMLVDLKFSTDRFVRIFMAFNEGAVL